MMAEIAYADKLQAMDDGALVDEIESKVWLSAYAANNGRSKYHTECDLTHDEARRRGKPWLYQRGWNKAYESCGHSLSDDDIARALSSHPSYAGTKSESGNIAENPA